MAGSSSEGRSSAQDFSEGKWNGGLKKSRVMIRIQLGGLLRANSVTTSAIYKSSRHLYFLAFPRLPPTFAFGETSSLLSSLFSSAILELFVFLRETDLLVFPPVSCLISEIESSSLLSSLSSSSSSNIAASSIAIPH